MNVSLDHSKKTNKPTHLADDAVLHVGLLVASLLTHQSDLQLAERFGQNVTLCEELPPLHNVRLQQRRVILVTKHSLRKGERHKLGSVCTCRNKLVADI